MRIDVVTAFLTRDDRILLGRRGEGVGTYRGRWAAVSGHRESRGPRKQAVKEIREETEIEEKNLRHRKTGKPLYVDDQETNRYWKVFPFRFALVSEATPRTDDEHREFRWVEPVDLAQIPTVPRLEETWQRVT